MDLIHIAELTIQFVMYYLALAIANRAFEPKRRQVTLLLVALAEVGLTIVLQIAVANSPVGLPIRLASMVLTFVPYFALYSRRCWLRALCYGALITIFSGVALLASSAMITMATGTAMVSVDISRTPIQLAGVFMEASIVLVLLYAASGFLRRNPQDKGINWLGYSLFIFSQYALIFLCILLEYANPNLVPAQLHILLICVGLCVAADVMLFLTIKRNIMAVKTQSENHTLKQLQSMHQRHGQELQAQYRRASISRHDMNNHLAALDILLGQDPEKARAYLSGLIAAQKIGPQAVFCDSAALNAALYAKSQDAAQAGVVLDIQMKLPAQLPFDDLDLVGIVTNLLDNAVAAVGGLPQEERRVKLAASAQSGHLVIRCENPCAQVLFEQGLPVRPRGEGQGYGIRSIHDTAKKLGGEARFSAQNRQFVAVVALPIPSN